MRPAKTSRIALALLLSALVAPALLLAASAAESPAPAPAPKIVRLDPPEEGFFSKQVDYRGIPIKAHAVVADEALLAAYGWLDKMLGHMPGAIENLSKAGCQLHIIGKDQNTSDLPENRRFKGKPWDGKLTIDERTRGIGGLVASCGEENLLRLPGDRYKGRNICVHEFSHTLFDYGLTPEVRARIEAQYRRSLDKGLWKNAYSATSANEFLAELAMWYFGFRGDLGMPPPKPAPGPEGLKQYDPEAYALLDDLYNGRIAVAANRRATPAAQPPEGRMLWGDTSRIGRPFSKDPCVIKRGGRYLMYYSMPPATDKSLPKGWAIGIAESADLIHWKKCGEILPQQECEKNGLVNGKAIVLDGKVHLFYNSYGNAKNDALCHAVSDDGLKFARDPTNPILRATGNWNSGRAIDLDVIEDGNRLFLVFATRNPTMKIQMLVAAEAPRQSDFGRAAWNQLGDGPILKPELPWETQCIEAPSMIKRGDTYYLFYGGGYNNDPQQIGCAASTDGLHWTRLFTEPLLANGKPGEWNSSESGHPGVFVDDGGQTYLFFQGNPDKGHTWLLSWVRIGWKDDKPHLLRD